MRIFSRRQFLALLSACITLPAAGEVLGSPRQSHIATDYLYELLGSLVGHSQPAAAIGLAYLELYDDMDGVTALKQDLGTMLVGDPDRDLPRLDAYLQERYHEDFVSRDSVVLQHWLIPRNEARLFALLAQSAQP